MRKKPASFKQGFNHQIFGHPHHPVRHVGRTLLRGTANIANTMVHDMLSGLVGFGRSPRKRRRKYRRR